MPQPLLILTLTAATLSLIPLHAPPIAPPLPAQLLPVYGGAGGTAFSRDCGAGKALTGLRYRDGLFVDALGLLCRPVLADGTLGPESTVGTLVGGGGGKSGSVSCRSGRVVVSARIFAGAIVNGVLLRCKPWAASTRQWTGAVELVTDRIGNVSGTTYDEGCEADTQPASGIRGRSGLVLDAVGFVCDEP